MTLNRIWAGAFLVALVTALFKLIFTGNTEIFPLLVKGLFESGQMAIMDIALPLAGTMAFWLGILNIGEKAGIVQLISRLVGPFFSRLFPELPRHHPAHGQMMMNFSANMLGLDNAATPFGLKAMASLQEANPDQDIASNAQIMLLVLLTSGLTILPISIIAQRAILGAQDPTDIFVPTFMATYVATLVGIVLVSIKQNINLWNRVMLIWLVGFPAALGALLWGLQHHFDRQEIDQISSVASNLTVFAIPVFFIAAALWRKVDVFSVFIEGARSSFDVSLRIFPYLIAMLAAISVLRNSGALDILIDGLRWAARGFNIDLRFIDALPVALMRPFSGAGARAIMIDTMQTFGADSFAGRLASIFQGTTDTTFYIVALYFGSVGIKNVRYAITVGLLADLAGALAAVGVTYLFFN